MTFLWKVVTVIISESVKWSDQSIAGVTFMDHFDFEYRYRNLYECDPLYWHPLHLPENCVQMYEKLIRSRVAAKHPFRVVKGRNDGPVHLGRPSSSSSELCEDSESYEDTHAAPSGPTYFYKPSFSNNWISPYEQMLNHIRTDVENQPRAPTIEVIPNLGPAAVYRQPISKISEMAIKKIAKAHKPLQSNEDDEYEISLTKDGKDMLRKEKPKKDPEDQKYIRKTIQKDNMFVQIEHRKII